MYQRGTKGSQTCVSGSEPKLFFRVQPCLTPKKEGESVKTVKGSRCFLKVESWNLSSPSFPTQVLAHSQYQKSKRISIFLSMHDEIETEDIIKDIFQRGKTCFIPRYQPQSSHMDMVRLASPEEVSSLPKTCWNIPQPGEEEVREEALSTGELVVLEATPRGALRLRGGQAPDPLVLWGCCPCYSNTPHYLAGRMPSLSCVVSVGTLKSRGVVACS